MQAKLQPNMTKQECIKYLREQSFFIQQLADDLENNAEPQLWCIDLPLPEYEHEKEQQMQQAEFVWKAERDLEKEAKEIA